jgi:lipoprotein Spr
MKKTLAVFCFVYLIALTGKSQTTAPQKMEEQIKHLVLELPGTPPSIQLIKFAQTLIGIPYRYASSNPDKGFDCSGFVRYVFDNFGFTTPRSSGEYVKAGKPVSLANAKVGDVLIFTGSNPKIRKVGHVGIVYAVDGDHIKFIHSSSGKAKGVTITEMNAYYKSRFLKAVSII